MKGLDLGKIPKEEQIKVLEKVKDKLPKLRVTIKIDGKTRYVYAKSQEAAEAYCKFVGATIIEVRDER